MERRALDGVSVVDITQVIAGPLCGRMLADLCADVIKIDRPPPAGAPAAVRSNAASPALNLGKRSIAIDLASEQGNAVARELIGRADVVLENFRPGALSKLGLGYEQLSAQHPRLIFASISGFGQDGPRAGRRAFGSTAHAEAGLLWLQQRALGSDAPFAPGLTIADIVTGMNACSGVLAALYDREQSGRGQHIDVSLVESQFAMLFEAAGPALNGGVAEHWRPFRHPIFEAQDGFVCINPGPAVWPRVAEGLGHPGAPPPTSIADFQQRVAQWAGALTLDELERGMDAAGAPFGIVRSMQDAVELPYFAERGMIAELPDPIDGTLRAISSPIHLSEAATTPTGPAPLAGEQTRSVLGEELGYSAERIDALLADGAVAEQVAP
ncbi:MAG: CoA transferase [Dehalococcoidia bacterium]